MRRIRKTAAELRHTTNQRVKRFNARMKDKGFKQLNIFASEQFINELKILKDELDLPRHEALDHILKGYLANKVIKNSVNKNDKTSLKKTHSLQFEESVNTADPSNFDKSLIDNPDEYKPWLVGKIRSYRNDGFTFPQIAEKLNGQNIKPIKSDSWKGDMVRNFFNKNKKKF